MNDDLEPDVIITILRRDNAELRDMVLGLREDLNQVISTVIEYHLAATAYDGYQPEIVRIDDPIDRTLEARLNAIIPAWRALIHERTVPSRKIAEENAALRAELHHIKRLIRQALGPKETEE